MCGIRYLIKVKCCWTKQIYAFMILVEFIFFFSDVGFFSDSINCFFLIIIFCLVFFPPSKRNAELIYANITDDMTHPPAYYFSYAQSILKTSGTSHISVIDKDNNMVAVTT